MEGNSSLGMKENVAGLLCYLASWITGLIFYLLEKESKFVKFHAAQSLVTFGSLTVLSIVISILTGIFSIFHLGFIFQILGLIVWIVFIIFWIMGMVTAYQGKTVKFPLFGDIAESFVNKNNP
jgi:uncharacterized membrane protein